MLAFTQTGFNNPQERLNKEIRRRTGGGGDIGVDHMTGDEEAQYPRPPPRRLDSANPSRPGLRPDPVLCRQ